MDGQGLKFEAANLIQGTEKHVNNDKFVQMCVKLVKHGANLRKARKMRCKSYRKLVKYGANHANLCKARKTRCKFV